MKYFSRLTGEQFSEIMKGPYFQSTVSFTNASFEDRVVANIGISVGSERFDEIIKSLPDLTEQPEPAFEEQDVIMFNINKEFPEQGNGSLTASAYGGIYRDEDLD